MLRITRRKDGRACPERSEGTEGRNESGFTLIELLVVLAIIAVLAGLVGPMVFRNVGDAKVQAARAQIELFALALDQYRLDNDYYPSTEQGLASLRVRPDGEPEARNWRGPYLRKAVPHDPWGRAYLYESPAPSDPNGYELFSYGRDGKAGGEGEDTDVGREWAYPGPTARGGSEGRP